MSDLYDKLGGCHPDLKQGIVKCGYCGKTININSYECLRNGWPECCGYTMTLMPATRRPAPDADEPVCEPTVTVRDVRRILRERTATDLREALLELLKPIPIPEPKRISQAAIVATDAKSARIQKGKAFAELQDEVLNDAPVPVVASKPATNDVAASKRPDPTWPDAKCGECGWCKPWNPKPDAEGDCRRVAFGVDRNDTMRISIVKVSDPACPDFVRRPQAQAQEADGDL